MSKALLMDFKDWMPMPSLIKGWQIRLLIAGASFPQYAVNAGREVSETSMQRKNATHIVRYGGESTSKILLPVVAQALI